MGLGIGNSNPVLRVFQYDVTVCPMDGLIKRLTEHLKCDIRAAEQLGDRQTAAGLKKLHGYYLSFAEDNAG